MSREKRMDKKIEFIYDSIHDIQSTIRAVDTKVATLLIVISIPLTNIGKIVNHLENLLFKGYRIFGWILVVVFVLSWILSLVAAVRAITAIDDPLKHINNSSRFKGAYYGGKLYKMGFIDVFLNRDILKASKDVDGHYVDFPEQDIDIAKELIFEQMKLAYIRDIKICRFNFSIQATYLWFSFGLIIYFCSRFM